MKWPMATVLLLLAPGLTRVAGGGELLPHAPEAPPPALSLSDLSGQQHRLRDYRGEVVLVNFWASWCPPCLAEMPGMERLAQAMQDRPFRILAVNSGESRATVWKFRKLMNIGFPTLLDSDGAATRAWGVEIFPTSYLVDGDGRIRYRVLGALEWDAPESRAVIESLLPQPAHAASAAPLQVSP